MPSTLQGSRLRFLEKAARHYAVSAPATSAHLMLQRNVEADRHPTAIIEEAGSTSCKACGMLLIPGSTARMSIESAGAKRLRRSKHKMKGMRERESKPEDKKRLIVECSACHRFETKQLPANVKSIKNAAKTTKAADIGFVTLLERNQNQKIVSKNASSKQRAKARKGGLQQILEKSRLDADPANPDFNLMDFMKRD